MALLRARADLPIEAGAPFYEASSTTSQAALVKAGLGVALLPALAAERVREPGLAYALLARPTVVRTVCIIRHKEYPLSPASQALIRAIHDYLRTATLPAGCKRVREIPGRPKPEPGLSQ
ncbi:LysR substrate binding domain protein [compost metagenome]